MTASIYMWIMAVAKRLGRRYVGIDIRESQVEVARKRLDMTAREMFA